MRTGTEIVNTCIMKQIADQTEIVPVKKSGAWKKIRPKNKTKKSLDNL